MHTVAVGEFEGPLGLLLDLVERNQMPVSDIAIGALTGQYLEHIRQLEQVSADELGEFLQLGSRLLYIKSLSLLPQSSQADQAEELRQLHFELEEYRRYQAAARTLGGRLGKPVRSWGRPEAQSADLSKLPLPNLELTELAKLFQEAIKEAPPAPSHGVIRPELTLEDVMSGLQKQLRQGAVELTRVIAQCRDRLELLVTFLAVLELVKAGAAQVHQDAAFAAITLEAV